MDRNNYADSAFAYVSNGFKLLRHHVEDGSVDEELLNFALSSVEIMPIFETNSDEVRVNIKKHLEEHKNTLSISKLVKPEIEENEDEFDSMLKMMESYTEQLKKILQKKGIKQSINAEDFLDKTDAAVWTTKFVNDLPNSSFAVVEKGGKKDDDGKTVPRNYRHLPYKDANGKIDLPHLRNALARMNQIKAWSPEDSTERIREVARKVLVAAAKKALPGSKFAKESVSEDGSDINVDIVIEEISQTIAAKYVIIN